MNRKDRLSQERKRVAQKCFGGVCFFNPNEKFGKGFQFHHIDYADDKRHSDFKNPLDYQEYILPRIEKEPERFICTCKKHHGFIERKLKKMSKDTLLKLVFITLLTKENDNV